MISVLILTLNEEANLPRCLESLKWSDDIVVLDSFSNDRTVDIAKSAGARVIQRKFDNWADHQNWAVQNIEFKHRWVYYSDADEVVTPELRDEMLLATKGTDSDIAAYSVRYKNFFCGRWIKHCGIYPVWIVRLFKPKQIRWERLVNPRPRVDGSSGKLQQHFIHYSFNKGLDAWIEKHNRYSRHEAIESLKSLREAKLQWSDAFSRDPVTKRAFYKQLSFRMPARPMLRFLYMYFFKLGFLDGIPGFHYCRLLAIYEYMIVLKMEELRRREKGLPI